MIHINIGSNLDSKYGNKFRNISLAIDLLIHSKLRIRKISSFYETPSYPNKALPKYVNIGLIADYNFNYEQLLIVVQELCQNCAEVVPTCGCRSRDH